MLNINKKWLNKGTPEWLEVLKEIENNSFNGVWMLRGKWKVSNALEKEIDEIRNRI